MNTGILEQNLISILFNELVQCVAFLTGENDAPFIKINNTPPHCDILEKYRSHPPAGALIEASLSTA